MYKKLIVSAMVLFFTLTSLHISANNNLEQPRTLSKEFCLNHLITIRHATDDDTPELVSLITQLGYPCSQQEFDARFQEFIHLDGYGVAVACTPTHIIGLIAWSKSKLFISTTTRIHIEALVIDEQHRGQGVGKQLIAFVENIAKQFSPSIIDLTSGMTRAQDGTHEFYNKLGYSNEGASAKIYLRKKV